MPTAVLHRRSWYISTDENENWATETSLLRDRPHGTVYLYRYDSSTRVQFYKKLKSYMLMLSFWLTFNAVLHCKFWMMVIIAEPPKHSIQWLIGQNKIYETYKYSANHITKQICTADCGRRWDRLLLVFTFRLRPRAICENFGAIDRTIVLYTQQSVFVQWHTVIWKSTVMIQIA